MGKYLIASLISIFTVLMLSTMVVFSNDTVEGNMTSTTKDTFENGSINLDGIKGNVFVTPGKGKVEKEYSYDQNN